MVWCGVQCCDCCARALCVAVLQASRCFDGNFSKSLISTYKCFTSHNMYNMFSSDTYMRELFGLLGSVMDQLMEKQRSDHPTELVQVFEVTKVIEIHAASP